LRPAVPGLNNAPKWAEGREIRNVSSLSLLGLVFFMLVMIGAFAVRSAAGFGAVLIAMPMLAFVLPISTAVSVTTALTAITSVHHLGRDWRRVAWRHFAIMAFYSGIGIGLGFYFIQMLDEHALRRSLGAFLIFYSIYALATAKASGMVSARWRGPLAAGTGVAGGLLGTLFGAGVGPIYVVYFNALRLEEGDFSGNHEHRRAARRRGSNSGVCEPWVLRMVEPRVDRDRPAPRGGRLLAGRQGNPEARAENV
jgi:MFS family permease